LIDRPLIADSQTGPGIARCSGPVSFHGGGGPIRPESGSLPLESMGETPSGNCQRLDESGKFWTNGRTSSFLLECARIRCRSGDRGSLYCPHCQGMRRGRLSADNRRLRS
jgi:hypothetical protein